MPAANTEFRSLNSKSVWPRLGKPTMTQVDEIGPDVYRISIYAPDFRLTFNHFLVRDDEPLLFHAGLRRMFPQVSAAVARLIEPTSIRYIGFSHFELDECGALNHWLQLRPIGAALRYRRRPG